MDAPEVMDDDRIKRAASQRRNRIPKGSASSMSFDASSNSSLHSISTQTSVYAPTFNPRRQISADWYDDSDTSNPPSVVPTGYRIDLRSAPGMTQIAEDANLSESERSETSYGGSRLRLKSRNNGYSSDANSVSSMGSIRNSRSRMGSIRLDSGGEKGFSHHPRSLTQKGRFEEEAKKGEEEEEEDAGGEEGAGIEKEQDTNGQSYDHGNGLLTSTHQLLLTSRHKKVGASSSSSSSGLHFKERNFNFDFETNSFTSSVNGMHESVEAFSYPSQNKLDIFPPLNSMNEGHNSDYLARSRRVSNLVGESRDMGSSIEDNHSVSMSSKASMIRPSHHNGPTSSTPSFKSPFARDMEASHHVLMDAPKSNKEDHYYRSSSSIDGGSIGGGQPFISMVTSKSNATIERVMKDTGNKGTILLCIPRGACTFEGEIKKLWLNNSTSNKHLQVKDNVKMLWADLHQPTKFEYFLCHAQQAQLLRQLISQGNCPHILFHGAHASGKRSLILTLIHELFGPTAWKECQIQRGNSMIEGTQEATLA